MILLWRVTTRCNYACGFCAYDRRVGGVRREADEAEVARVGQLFAEWGRARGERVLLSLLGGEPLLWRPMLPLARTLAGEGLAISATTNGSTLHRAETRRAIVESFAELTVSLDGPEALHDRLRGASGAHARVRDGVRALVAERKATGAALRLRANVVLMRDTLPHFAALCETLADWGVDEITFNQLGGRDRPDFFPAQRLQVSDVQGLSALLPNLVARLSARGVRLCADGLYLHRLHASAAGVPLSVSECQLGREFLFVDEHGIIAPCSFSGADYGVPIASVRTVGDVDALHARFRAAQRMKRCEACNDCPSTQAFAKFAA